MSGSTRSVRVRSSIARDARGRTVASAKAGLALGDAHLAWSDANLGRVGTPVSRSMMASCVPTLLPITGF